MNGRPRVLVLVAAAACLAACGPSQEEVERLRRENEALRGRLEQRKPPGQLPPAIAGHFANDPALGTLAGLLPGATVMSARQQFGPETRTRSWMSENELITQYEWDLVGGLQARLNADPAGRLTRVAVVLADPQAYRIPTLYGLTLGEETYARVARKFAAALTTDLHHWGARGLFTIAQRVELPESRRRLEFLYEMPAGLARPELDRIGFEVHERGNPAVLEPYLADRAPFLIAIEETE